VTQEASEGVIWVRPARPAGRPAGHSLEEITEAAIQIADQEGLPAVSMRRVAARLGTGAASLYRYVDNREDLLDLMIDATAAEYHFTPPSGDWLADLLGIGEQARGIMRRHRWLPSLLITRSVLGPNGLVLLEHVLEALAGHPASTAAKLEAFAVFNATTALFAHNELTGGSDRQRRNAAYLRYTLVSGHRPRLAELLASQAGAPDGDPPDPQNRYRDILARILTGLLPLTVPFPPVGRLRPRTGGQGGQEAGQCGVVGLRLFGGRAGGPEHACARAHDRAADGPRPGPEPAVRAADGQRGHGAAPGRDRA
jgi:AcrR family transcriptional regulator